MRFFLIIVCCLSSLAVEAQSDLDSTRIYPKSVGLNANFINSFLPLDNDVGLNAPYLFSARKYKNDRGFSHQGLNISFEGVFDDPEDDPKQNTNQIGIDYRIGWGKHWQIHEKVVMYGGGDLLLESDFSGTKTSIEDNFSAGTNKRNVFIFGTGGGPFVGIQYNFSKRFGVYTEAAFYLKVSYKNEKFDKFIQIVDIQKKILFKSEVFVSL